MVIEKAAISDAEEILSLQKLAYTSEAELYNDFTIPPLFQSLEEITDELSKLFFLKVVMDWKIVGSVRAYLKENTCYIGRLIVHPDYQNRGIGKKMMKAIEKCFAGARYELFTGHMSSKNISFYEKLGYKRFKTEKVSEDLQFVYMEKEAGVQIVDRMENVKNHFEEEAKKYDGVIKNLIPYYYQMVEAIVNTLPFRHSDNIEVLDLGCGTGTVSRMVKDVFPEARLTCLDIADNMLQMARLKMANSSDVTYINIDFYHFDFDKQYNAVVSSLALHHLVTDKDKLDFYKKIYSGIKQSGVFVNADVVLASTDILQQRYMEYWKRFMYKGVSSEEMDNIWIPKYYEEDRPVSLMKHFDILKEAGFNTIDVVWKYYNFAVYMAVK
jgi:Methylase involved in ubiquinone/menaquinone biosynthesis